MEIQELYVTLALKNSEFVQGTKQAAAAAQDFGRKVNAEMGTTMQRTQSRFREIGAGAAEMGRKFMGAMSTVATALIPVGVAMGAVVAGAKAMWDSLNKGAELELARSRFENLTQSIGTTADSLLSKMREATRGMISDAQLMASGADIISLGLAKTEDQTVRLASVVGQLGWDMQQVILTFANNSTMRLDALGLSVEAVTTRAKELEEQGMSMDAAFDLAVIEAGEAKIALLGSAADTTKGKLAQMQTVWENAVDAFHENFADSVVAQIDRVADSIQDAGPGIEQGMAQLGTRAGNALGWALNDMAGAGLASLNEDLISSLGLTNKEIAKLYETAQGISGIKFALGGEDLLKQQIALNNIIEEQYALELQIADARSEWEDWGAAEQARQVRKLTEHYRELAVVIEAAYTPDTMDAMTTQTQAVTNRYAAWVDATNARNRAAEEHRAAMLEEQASIEGIATAAEEAAAAFSALVQGGGFSTELPGADKPLIAPAKTFSYTTQISGPTEEQADILERYAEMAERAANRVQNLTAGIGTYGMTQEEVNKKVEDARGEMEYYQQLMGTIPPVVSQSSTAQQDMAVNIDAARQAMFDQLVQAEAAPEIIAAFGAATGIMSHEQYLAAMNTLLLQDKIKELVALIAGGYPIEQALIDLDEYAVQLEETGAAALEGLKKGIEDGVPEVVKATEEAAQAIIDATVDVFQIESPSRVFAAIGDNLGVGLVEGFSANIAAAQSTLQSIGESVIAGVNRGIEAGKASLREMLSGVAGLIPNWLKEFLGIASPAAAVIPIGVAIGDALVVGVQDRINEAIEEGELVDIIDEWLRTASTLSGIASTAGRLFGDQVLSPMEANINGLIDQIDGYTMSLENMAATLGLDASSSSFYHDLFWMQRAGTAEQQHIAGIAMSFYEHRADLIAETAQAQAELVEQEERLLALEEKRSQLDFLRQQYELIKLVRDNGLDASILDGIAFGIDADAGMLMDAMIEAMQQMIGAVENELGIHSPSRWAMGLMHNVFDTLASTADAESQALEQSVRRALSPVLMLPDDTGGRGSQSVDNSRRSTNYGGIHIYGEARRRSPLELLEEMR